MPSKSKSSTVDEFAISAIEAARRLKDGTLDVDKLVAQMAVNTTPAKLEGVAIQFAPERPAAKKR